MSSLCNFVYRIEQFSFLGLSTYIAGSENTVVLLVLAYPGDQDIFFLTGIILCIRTITTKINKAIKQIIYCHAHLMLTLQIH